MLIVVRMCGLFRIMAYTNCRNINNKAIHLSKLFKITLVHKQTITVQRQKKLLTYFFKIKRVTS